MSNGKLVRIAETGVAAGSGRNYAMSLTGEAMFGRTKEMEFKKGQYAYVIERLQTKTFAEDGETLVDLAVPVTQKIMTSVFDNKAEAIEAVAETGLLAVEVAAEVVKGAKVLNLSDAAIAELASAW